MKEHILLALKEQFERWEELLAGLNPQQISAPYSDLDWSIKDVVGRLWAWQRISIARMETAAPDREPVYSASEGIAEALLQAVDAAEQWIATVEPREASG